MNVHSPRIPVADADLYPTRLPDGEAVIDRPDPVLWSDWSEDAPISRDDAGHYRDKGYLVRRDIFGADEISAMIEASQDLRDHGQAIRAEDLVTEPESDAVRTIFRLDEHSALFDRVSRDERMAGVAS